MIEFSGKVVHGKKYGRKLGFPTANLDRRQFARDKIKSRLGIYAGWAKINPKSEIRNPKQYQNSKILISKPYGAAIIIGPVDYRGLPKLEAHLLNFTGDLYGKKITISLKKFIRPFKQFKGEAELKKQIKQDLNIIKKITNGKQ